MDVAIGSDCTVSVVVALLGRYVSLTTALLGLPLLAVYVCPGKLNIKVYVPVWSGVKLVIWLDVVSETVGKIVVLTVPSGATMVKL